MVRRSYGRESAPSSFSPVQLIAPIMLIVCLILFFLPWISFQVVPPASQVKNMPKEAIEMTKKEFGIDPTKPLTVMSQSGLQAAGGTASVGSDLKRAMEKMTGKFGKEFGGAGMKPDKSLDDELNAQLKKEKDVTAPLVYLFPIALVGGIVLGFIPWASTARKIIVAGCCLLAFGVVAIQGAMGFPLENKIKEKTKGAGGGGGGVFGVPGMGGMGGGGGGDGEVFRASWQIPLYLTLLLVLGAGGTAFLGPVSAGKAKRKAYDFDDEDDDDDDDDRRRKKRRAAADDDDDDDDDRPRKKRARAEDDDDEEDERPKKRRRDDDDDDDRPRKKRRRDDDD